ncbi:MAG: response regulator transcription factor [Chitinophagaceae bacterium]|nr:response regulator transcription factor [Chitinophagaceae bacterium]
MDKITILIADDHTLVRETWSFILNTDSRFQVIAESRTGEEAVELAKKLRPNVAIMDINLPGMNGIEATQQIRKYSPGTRILGVSLHTQPTYARKMMQKGAMGYVTKNSSREEMFKAILEINNGKKYICDEIKNILSEQVIQGDDVQTGLNSLSQREIEIITFIKKGYSSKEIADALNISVKTVEVHRYNILKKLNLRNAAALVNFINNSELELEN